MKKPFWANSLKKSFLCLLLLFTLPNISLYRAADISAPHSAFDREAAGFTLEDQFGNKTTVKFPASKSVILVFGDREGSEQVEGWVRPLYNRFGDRVFIFGIAELSAVPWVARPIVRGIIKSKSDNSIMLDWSGKTAKSYGCEKGKANVFVINRDGVIKAVKRGAANSRELQSLYASVEPIL
jgi:hypothetical protein